MSTLIDLMPVITIHLLLTPYEQVHGVHSFSKPALGNQYLNFETSSLQSSCSPTAQYKPHMFMPHSAIQFHSFVHSLDLPKNGAYSVESKVTYLLSRDEDCENSFHSTADFVSVFHILILSLLCTMLIYIFDSCQLNKIDEHVSRQEYIEHRRRRSASDPI